MAHRALPEPLTLILLLATLAGPALAEPPTVQDQPPIAATPAPSGPDGGASGGTPPRGDGAAAVPEPTAIKRRAADDPAVVRGFLTPTALVAPRGSATVTVQALAWPVVGVRVDGSLTDRLSLGAGAIGGVADEHPVVAGSVHGTFQLWAGRRSAVAASFSAYLVRHVDGEASPLPIAALVGSRCFGDRCGILLSASVHAVAASTAGVGALGGGVALVSGGRFQFAGELQLHPVGIEIDGGAIFHVFLGGRHARAGFTIEAGVAWGEYPPDLRGFTEAPCQGAGCDGEVILVGYDGFVPPTPVIGVSIRW